MIPNNDGYMTVNICCVTIWAKVVSYIIHAYFSVISIDKIVFMLYEYVISDDNCKANSICSICKLASKISVLC